MATMLAIFPDATKRDAALFNADQNKSIDIAFYGDLWTVTKNKKSEEATPMQFILFIAEPIIALQMMTSGASSCSVLSN